MGCKIFHGEWWVPAKRYQGNVSFMFYSDGAGKKFIGTLTYNENSESVLELYHVPSDFHSRLYHHNDVMWGQDANGILYTLFRVNIKNRNNADFTNTKFNVDLILIGEHVLSIDDACFSRCVVQFPYLRNWAFHNNLNYQRINCIRHFALTDACLNTALVESLIDDKIKWKLHDQSEGSRNAYDLSISQTTEFVIESTKDFSVSESLELVKEFSQLLSIALYCEQNPSKIELFNQKMQKKILLLFEQVESVEPKGSLLIRFNELQKKMPMMLRIWHENYENISPISGYLIASLKNNRYFGTPDFLIIAQALDGYFKRFVGKNINERIHRYEKQIEKLLDQFKDIDVIKKCHIDPVVLKDSRHKYSHLFPDDEPSQAVAGEDLYWLTEKSKILLTCCILDMLGLSTEEINLCCNNSPISKIAEEFETEEWLNS